MPSAIHARHSFIFYFILIFGLVEHMEYQHFWCVTTPTKIDHLSGDLAVQKGI